MVNNDVVKRWYENCGESSSAMLEALRADPIAFEDAFARDLVFGTGGLRGKVGIGPSRLNVWTIGKATQGLADWLNARCENPSVAIVRDSRQGGPEFCKRAAEVLAANDIRVILFNGVASTPELSFAVRDLGCTAGVCVTASHNPAEYNGYKVYGPDGCQITTGDAREIQAAIDAVDVFDGVRCMPIWKARERGLVLMAGLNVRKRYLDAVASELEGVDVSTLRVAYTPLNGTGGLYVPELWSRMGAEDILMVPEQAAPDGDFPTCPYPNPELPEAMRMVTGLAETNGCDLALATDPDSDRVGVAVFHSGSYRLLTGNELGELLFDWLCSRAVARGENLSRSVCVTTVVSAPRADDIARHWGVQLRRTLTGFKFIGEQVGLLERTEDAGHFFFGLEESCGYLKGSYVRDKDGIEALALVCEMTADYKSRDMDLVDALDDLGNRVGYCASRQVSRTFEGAEGAASMRLLMDSLREDSPTSIGELNVISTVDYSHGAIMSVVNPFPADSTQELPATNLLEWRLSGGSKVMLRPSGTEPKIKAYCFTRGDSEDEANKLLRSLVASVNELI